MLLAKTGLWACFLLAFYVLIPVARAQPYAYGVAAPGYSGLGLTPSASPIDWGAISLDYGTVIPGANALGSGLERGHNINLTMGVLPGLEVAARIATNDLDCNLYGLNGGCPRRPRCSQNQRPPAPWTVTAPHHRAQSKEQA